MNTITTHIMLLAQRDRWERLGDRFRSGRSFDGGDLAIWVGILAAVALTMFWLSRHVRQQETPRASRNPRTLFRELCSAHGLNRDQRRLLTQLADAHQLPHPAALFLEPERFAPEHVPSALKQDGRRLATLRKRLFKDGEETNADSIPT